MSVGRNDLCPCGSGQKYKKCCESRKTISAGASTGAAVKRTLSAEELAANMQFGVRCHQAGELEQAAAIYRQVLAHNPRHADASHLLGVIAYHSGQLEEAQELISQAIKLAPQTALFYDSLGRLLMCKQQVSAAIKAYRTALNLNPQLASSCNDLAVALLAENEIEEAERWCRCAIEINPASAESRFNLGNALARQNRFDEAIMAYREAIRLQPNYVEAHNSLGLVFSDQANYAAAVACFEQAIALDPQSVKAHFNLALARLVLGDWQRGFPEFEWRWQLDGIKPPAFTEPRWDGQSLAGRTILLCQEQGLGDTIHFVRYAALVKNHSQASQVIVRCQSPLVPLLTNCTGINRVVSANETLPDFDVYAPLLSLPLLLGTTPETIPHHVPSLTADPLLVEHWRARLAAKPTAFRIGICWQGNPQNKSDHRRSFPLACFAPLAALERVQLISLQKGAGSEQLEACAFKERIMVMDDLTGPQGNLSDAAAVMMSLDLVITPDTALAHLAGALGVKVWVPLAFAADWRWLLKREDTSWYPTMRLFRQQRLGCWDEVFERMKNELLIDRTPALEAADQP